MKKSTLAVAALLTALSTVPVMSVAYAEEQPPASSNSSSCTGCKSCKASDCKGCKGCNGCKAAGCNGCQGQGADE